MGVKRVNSCDGSVLIKTPLMSGGGPNIDCPAALGESSWACRNKNASVRHVGSWFLVSD